MAYIGSSPTKVVSRQSANIFTYTATANQTAFTGSDANGNTLACTPSDIMVHMNGLRLEESDFTATTTTVTLGSGAAAGDEVTITAFVTFETADAYTKSASDTRYVNTTGDTMSGALTVDAAAATPLTVDRATNDGTIIDVQKSGVSVGSIGTASTDIYIGTGDTGIRFNDAVDGVLPYNTSSGQTDGTLDLGFSSVRWRDLYLSGGVYVGGTDASHKLSDVETGTWTPALTRTGSNYSHSYQLGTYEKIGRLVVASFSLNISSITTQGSGYNQLSGLPFTPSAYNASLQFVGSVGMSFALTSAHSFYWAGAIFFVDSNSNPIQTNFTTGLMSGFITYKTAA